MPITAQRLEVDVQADTSDARRDLDRFSRSTTSSANNASAAGSKVAGAGKKFSAMGALVKTAAGSMVAAMGTKVVMAASDLNEQVSKTGVVFGPQAKIVTDSAQQMADQFGMSKTVFLEAASGIGLVGKASGLSRKGAAALSTDMAKLAADASSFYNVPVTEALDAMKSGLVGEAEPMRRFGVLLSDAAVQAESARLGLSNMGDELTEGQKVQARSSLIMKGMTDASGDLERTQSSVSNRLREIQGRVQNFAADMGAKALPAVSAFLGGLIKAPGVIKGVYQAIKSWVDENQTLVTVLGMALGAVTAFLAVGKAVAMVKAATVAFKAWRAAIIATNVAMFANPIVLVVAAIAALVAAAFIAYHRFDAFRKIVDQVGVALKGGFVAALDWVKAKWAAWGPAIMATLAAVGNGIRSFIQATIPAFKAGFQVMVAVAKNVWNTIKGVIQGALSIIKGVINVVMGAIRGDWSRVWQGIKQILSGVWQVITSLVKGAVNNVKIVISAALGVIKSLWSAGWNALKGLVSRAWDGIVNAVKNGVGNVVSWVKGLPGKITGALGNLGSLLTNAGTQVIEGFWNGLKSKWEDVKAWFGSVTDAIPNLKGPRAKDRALLIENGKAVMEGFKEGLNREWTDVKRFLKAATKWVQNSAMDEDTSKALEKRLGRVGKRVKNLLARNTRLAEKYAAAVQKHSDLVQAQADFRQSTFQGMNAQANVMNSGNTGAAIAASLQAQVQKVKDFGLMVANLAARGLNKDAIAQITAAGVDGGYRVAQALAGATDTELGSINQSFAAIGASATSTADHLATSLHGAGVQAAQGVMDGLAAKQETIKMTLRTIAQSMLEEVAAVVRKATKQAAREAKQEADKAAKGDDKAPGGGKGPRGPGKPSDRVSGGRDRQGRSVNFSVTAHNPQAEPTSRTVNKGLDRAASLGLV